MKHTKVEGKNRSEESGVREWIFFPSLYVRFASTKIFILQQNWTFLRRQRNEYTNPFL